MLTPTKYDPRYLSELQDMYRKMADEAMTDAAKQFYLQSLNRLGEKNA